MDNYLVIAKRVVLEESLALSRLADNLPKDFETLVSCILNLSGRVILTGVGKSGYIARKIASSLASTGTTSFFVHPTEASHGDLGMITCNDLVIMLSNSGETKELFDIMNYCKRFVVPLVAMTMKPLSTIAMNSDMLLAVPHEREVSVISAPTNSSIMMLSLGDALVTAVHEARGFSNNDFQIYHPGGRIGKNLVKIMNLMRVGDQLPIVSEDACFTDTILVMNEKSLGCAIVTNAYSELVGIITDGDLRRHINELYGKCAKDIMTLNPKTITTQKLAIEALSIMQNKAITNIPVVEDNKLVGVVHIHDLLRAGVG